MKNKTSRLPDIFEISHNQICLESIDYVSKMIKYVTKIVFFQLRSECFHQLVGATPKGLGSLGTFVT